MLNRRSSLLSPKYRPDIDGLRALAVLSVVLFHAFPSSLSGGFVGVDIFFVISGYLISTILSENLVKGTLSLREFYARRIKRIFPSLLLVLGASFLAGWVVLLPEEFKQLGKHIAAGAGFASNFILWAESGYFDSAAETKPLLHLWSLGIEEQFYLLWPLLLWGAWRCSLNPLRLTVVLALASFMVNLVVVHQDPVAAFYSPHTRIWELLLGSAFALLALRARSDKIIKPHGAEDPDREGSCAAEDESSWSKLKANLCSLAGVLCIVYALQRFDEALSYPGAWGGLPTAGTILIIAAGPCALLNRYLFSNRLAVWFGLISYPLYLWHWPLLSFARLIEGDLPGVEIRGGLVLLSIVLAWFTHRFIENPVRSSAPRVLTVLVPVALMTCVGAGGYFTYMNGGFASRFPRVVGELLDFKYDIQSEYRDGTCFLRPDQDFRSFSECVDGSRDKEPLLLWGDSHAASLYRGVLKVFGDRFSLIQRSSSGCPPILNLDVAIRPHCREINDHVFDLIRREKLTKVIMLAFWSTYQTESLETTIEQLHSQGVRDIVVIGPLPCWREGLPKQLYLQFKNSIPHRLPTRMTTGLAEEIGEFDRALATRLSKTAATYVSALDILCDTQGCLTQRDHGSEGNSLVSWDHSHLTSAGSEFVASHLPKF